MEDYLEVEVAPGGGHPNLVVKETTSVFNKALITCIVSTPTCKDLVHTYIYQSKLISQLWQLFTPNMLNMDWVFVPMFVIKAQSKHVSHQAEDGYTQGQVNNLVDMESSNNYEWLATEILEVSLTKVGRRNAYTAHSHCAGGNPFPACILPALPKTPPLVVREAPPPLVYYRKGEEVTLKCVFEGGSDVNGVFWFSEEDERIDSTAPGDATAAIRAHFYKKRVSCSNRINHFTSELIIDTSRVNISNGTSYICSGRYFDGMYITYQTSLWTREGVCMCIHMCMHVDLWVCGCMCYFSALVLKHFSTEQQEQC